MEEATPALAAIVAAWRIEHDGVPHEAGETFLVPAEVAERLVLSGAAQPGVMPAPTPPLTGGDDTSAASANGENPPAPDQGESPEAEAVKAEATADAGDGSDAVAGTTPRARKAKGA
jgi:hypothetical protein